MVRWRCATSFRASQGRMIACCRSHVAESEIMGRFGRFVPLAASAAFYLVAFGATAGGYTNVPLAIGCFVVATGLLGFAAWHSIAEWLTGGNPFARKISLRDAALRLYEEFCETSIGRTMEGPTGTSPSGILDNAGTHILQNHLPLEVKRPPSTRWELLPDSEVGGLMVCEGATGLRQVERDAVKYTEPRLMRKDLARLIQEYRTQVRR